MECIDINDMNTKVLLPDTKKSTCMALKADCSKLCIGVRKKTLIFAINGISNSFRFHSYIPSKGRFRSSVPCRNPALHGVAGLFSCRGLSDRLLPAGHRDMFHNEDDPNEVCEVDDLHSLRIPLDTSRDHASR